MTVGIGNTNIAIGFIDGQKNIINRRPTYTVKSTEDLKKLFISSFLQCGAKPDGSIIASVVPELTKPCITAISAIAGRKPLIVDASIYTELNLSNYKGLLGSDRIAVCAAAWSRYKTACIAIDMGTAATLNIIGNDAVFLGGIIFPGIQMELEALNLKAAQLPKINLKKPSGLIGCSTEECILSGACYGTAVMIDGLIAVIKEILNCEMPVIMTGGGADLILPLLKTSVKYERDLLTEGLAVLYRQNRHIRQTEVLS